MSGLVWTAMTRRGAGRRRTRTAGLLSRCCSPSCRTPASSPAPRTASSTVSHGSSGPYRQSTQPVNKAANRKL